MDCIMTDQDQDNGALRTNFERLLSHLQEGSLAAQLVSAYAQPGEQTPAQALGKVIADRLDALKHSYDETENQPD
jgi:hypothetical protein